MHGTEMLSRAESASRQGVPACRGRSRREQGQTLVMAAVMMVVLLAFLALVVDLGNAFAQRRAMQNAADSGALAGARAMAMNQSASATDAAVKDFSTRNGATYYKTTVLSRTIDVAVSKTIRTYFASVVGVPTMTVGAIAEGGYSFPGSWKGNLMPICVNTRSVTITNQVLEIWDDSKMSSDTNLGIIADGERGWLNFDGGEVSDQELVDWVTNGYQQRVDVGTWINGTPGTKSSSLHAMDVVRTGTVIFMPIFDSTRPGISGSGSLDYHIVGFAAFYVIQVVDTGTPKFVKGRFIRYVAAQEGGGTFDTGVRVVGLQR